MGDIMFNKIKEKMKYLFNNSKDNKDLYIDYLGNEIRKNHDTDLIIGIDGDFTKMIIREEDNVINCLETIKKYKEQNDKFDIPFKAILFTGPDILCANTCEQTILVYKKDNYEFSFSMSDYQLRLLKSEIIDGYTYEEGILIDHNNDTYNIHKCVHDANNSTISVQSFSKSGTSINSSSFTKEEAYLVAERLVDESLEIDSTHDNMDIKKFIINFDLIEDALNLTDRNLYYPVNCDDILTLSWPCRFNETNINKRNYETFDIVLNSTKENVGGISFDYLCNSGFTYSGNVGYHINKDYQNNHYGTRALGLLVRTLKDNEFDGDKDLYIAATPENIASQKTALNNNAELIYDGDVPENDSVNYIDGLKKVKVYRIKM